MEIKYFECSCFDINHVTRVTFDEEDACFYFEYKIHKYPGKKVWTTIINKFSDLKHILKISFVYHHQRCLFSGMIS